MSYNVQYSTQFRRDIRKAKKRGLQLTDLFEVVEILVNGATLPEKNKDHGLTGDYAGCRECHIHPDWLLIYEKKEEIKLLSLLRTGTHSDLF